MKIFAKDELKETLLIKGYTIASIAEEIGIARQSVSAFVNGRCGIHPSNSKKILEILEVEFNEVFKIVKRGEK